MTDALAETTTLHLFTNDVETYAAESLNHLADVYAEHMDGDTLEDLEGKDWRNYWRQREAAEPVDVYWCSENLVTKGEDVRDMEGVIIKDVPEDERPYHEWDKLVSARADVWARFLGPGLLCSTEW